MLQCRGDSRIARKAKLGFVGHLERATQGSLPQRGQTPLEKACAFAQGKDIGLNPALGSNPRLRFEALKGMPGIALCTLHLPPADNDGMFLLDGQPEDFRHEQYLCIREGNKTVLFSGCSHKGIVQIAQAFRPDVLVGGFHLMRTEDPAILRQTARKLLTLPTRYATGHCTGTKQFEIMKTLMADRLDYWPAGTVAQL